MFQTLIMRVGEIIAKLMREQKVSAKEVSLSTGIPTSTLSQVLNSDQEPKGTALLKLARFFGVPMEYLVTGEMPEVAAIKETIGKLEDTFLEVHEGIYRLRVERLIRRRTDERKK